MGKGIRADLKARLIEAHSQGKCLVPVSPSDAKRLARARKRGDVVSPARRVYALPELWDTLKPVQQEAHKLRALSALNPSWVFAEASAAVLHGLSVPYRLMGTIHLAVPTHVHSGERPGIDHLFIKDDNFTKVGGVPITSLERTAFDCMRNYDFCSSLAIADSSLRHLGATPDTLVNTFEEHHGSHFGKERAIQIAMLANGLSENGGESIARAKMIQCGFLIPALQVWVDDPVDTSTSFRVDFCWDLPNGRVIGELDGREKYTNPAMTGGREAIDILADERLRESRLSGTDAKIMRFSFSDVMDTPKFCHLLNAYGIPSGYDVPWVAATSDVVNYDLRLLRPHKDSFRIGDASIHAETYDLCELRRQGIVRKDGRLRREPQAAPKGLVPSQ